MAALTSADVTVTVNAQDRNIAGADAPKHFLLATIAFGDGALTYPADGVPLPAVASFGLNKGSVFSFCAVQPPPDNGFVYKYDSTNHTLRIYTQGFLTGGTTIAGNENGALVTNSAGAEATGPRMPKTATGTTYDMGPMIELPTSIAPAATTVKLLAVGE